MIRSWSFLLGILLLTTGCKDFLTNSSNHNPPTADQYNKGQVVVTYVDNASFNQALFPVDSLNTSVLDMGGFVFIAPNQANKINEIYQELRGKTYLNLNNSSNAVEAQNTDVYIRPHFHDFTDPARSDWRSFLGKWSATDLPNQINGSVKIALISVPDGEEKLYVDKFKQFRMVQNAELNWIVRSTN